MLRLRQLPWVILVIGLWVILVLISGFSAPPPMHAWFNEHFTIGPSALPEGVKVEVVPRTAYEFPGEFLAISNVSETFLYLSAIERPYGWPTEQASAAPPVQLHSGGIPAFRVGSGKAYVWSYISREPRWELGWELVHEYRPSDPLRLYISGNRLTAEAFASFTYYLAEYEWRNKFDYGGSRPPDVWVPSPHDLMLLMDYGSDEFILPLTISYTLNEHYPTQDSRRNYSRDIAVAAGVVVAAAWLGFRFVMSIRAQTSRGL